jgi:hypothetical protein
MDASRGFGAALGILIIILFSFAILRIETRTMCMLGKHSTIKLRLDSVSSLFAEWLK